MSDLKHAVIIREEVYTDKLKTIVTRTKKKIISSDATILTDYIKCLASFTDHSTDELELHIKRSPTGEIRITKTWSTSKEQL